MGEETFRGRFDQGLAGGHRGGLARAPPLYFWMEYFWLYKPTFAAAAASDLELFKYGQDVLSKIWIAVTSALALLYFWKDFKQ
jgi:hypothetical protein